MKTSIISTIALMIILVASANAGIKEVSNVENSTEVAKLLEKRINYPSFVQTEKPSEYVAFELRVNEDKTLEFVPISADNLSLSKAVEKQIKKMESTLAQLIEPGKSQRYKLVFEKKWIK